MSVEPPAPDPMIPASAAAPVDPAPVAPLPELDREPESHRGRIGRWPFGILVVAVLRLIDAASLIYLFLDLGTTRPIGGVPIIGNSSDLTRALDLVLAGLVDPRRRRPAALQALGLGPHDGPRGAGARRAT